jgi:hypothetical protein
MTETLYEQDINENPNVPFDDPYPSYFVGDRFLASYTYGPLGPISRTAEYDDADLTNNRDHYYLRDASGGHRQKFEARSAKIETCEPGFPALEASNWPAEQALRPAVVNRKVFGGSRTWAGAHALLRGRGTAVSSICLRPVGAEQIPRLSTGCASLHLWLHSCALWGELSAAGRATA